MIKKTGDIWSVLYDKGPDVIFILVNGVISWKGLVMGAGQALEAKNRFPELPQIAATYIRLNPKSKLNYNSIWIFPPFLIPHIVLPIGCEAKELGLFQTKLHFNDPSPLEMVRGNIKDFHLIALGKEGSQKRFHLPTPGIGFGKLKYSDIEPDLRLLPDNVFVWSKS